MRSIKNRISDCAPDLCYAILASIYWTIHPNIETRLIFPKDNCWTVWTPDEKWYTLRESISRGSKSHQKTKFDRYQHGDFVFVEESDIVVDVGAFLGEFSIPASEVGTEVIAIEPDPRTFNCLKKQASKLKNVNPYQILLGEKTKEVNFKSATDPTESSFIDVDAGDYKQIEIETKRLDDFIREIDISQIDFLKIDAEGAEPEVLKGSNKLRISKLAIDAGNERNGESTVEEVSNILKNRGYEIKVDNGVVFARSIVS